MDDPPSTATDVLIVGAGPTGLLLANLLGRMGVRTVIVEQNASTVDAPRAVSIDDEALRAVQAAGLAEPLLPMLQQGYGSIYKGPGGRPFATVKPASRIYGFEKRNAFQQPELEALLRDGLSRFSCVNLRFRTRLRDFSQSEEEVVATVEAPARTRSIRARFMVACDGGRSATRKQLDIPMEGSTFREPWLIVDLESTQNRNFHTEVFCDPARPCITLPGPGGIRRYEFKLDKRETREDAEQESFARGLLARFGPDRHQPLRRVQVYTFHARVAARWRLGRVLLAGDAAHLSPPFAGQGMNSGIRDANNLAWKLAEVLAGGPVDRLLDSYERERKPHAKAMIRLAEQMGSIMMPRSRPQGALVRGAFRCLGLYPSARDYLATMKFKPKPRFTGGLVERDTGTAAGPLVGSLFPQPLVEQPDGSTLLLDELLPDRPAIVVYTENPDEAVPRQVAGEFADLGMFTFGLTPECCKARTSPISTGRDANRILQQRDFRPCLDHAMLLRRDRYVAASRPVQRLEELADVARALELNHRPVPGRTDSLD